MDYELIWFVLIAILFTGYFFLEGFDFGVGMLLPVLAWDETDRRVMLTSVGPFWDANEVWLITAGGAMFAAFPHWYATLFSGFYLALFLILLALILRGVGFEFRAKAPHPWWKRTCERFVFVGSLVPALLWGLAISNLVRGVPIDASMDFQGTLLTLLNPFSLMGGVVSVLVFALHGALFLSLRTDGELRTRALTLARRLWWPAAVILLVYSYWGRSESVIFDGQGLVPGTLPFLTMACFVAAQPLMRIGREGWAFAMIGATIVFGTAVAFQGLYPRVMPSTLSPAFDLTIRNASSSELTLKVMLVVALLFVPLVLAYQGWSYWVFRHRVRRESIGH